MKETTKPIPKIVNIVGSGEKITVFKKANKSNRVIGMKIVDTSKIANLTVKTSN